jgi:hypothetical protein
VDALAPIARLIERRRSAMAQNSPEGKPLRTFSFVIHATRGVIRNQNTRRKTMFGTVFSALVLLFCGSTILRSTLNPHEHPGWFILFWLLCAWLALTAMLLAVFDVLMVRAEGRKAERVLRPELPSTETPDSPRSTIDQ